MHKFTIVTWLLPEPPSRGYKFDSRSWPLHITIVPPFYSNNGQKKIISRVEFAVKDLTEFKVEVGQTEFFGKKQDVEVNVIKPITDMHRLHMSLINTLSNLGAKFMNEDFIKNGFKPHVTVYGDRRVNMEDVLQIKDVALVLHEPTGKRHEREVIADIILPSRAD